MVIIKSTTLNFQICIYFSYFLLLISHFLLLLRGLYYTDSLEFVEAYFVTHQVVSLYN